MNMASSEPITEPSGESMKPYDPSAGISLTNLPPFAQRMRAAADYVWEEGYRQPFLRELGEGTLRRERFAFYLLQDYRYLGEYAKVHALALTKTDDPEIMQFMVGVQSAIFNVESTVHRAYMASYGVSEEEMARVRHRARLHVEHPVVRLRQGTRRHPRGRAALRMGVRRLRTAARPRIRRHA